MSSLFNQASRINMVAKGETRRNKQKRILKKKTKTNRKKEHKYVENTLAKHLS